MLSLVRAGDVNVHFCAKLNYANVCFLCKNFLKGMCEFFIKISFSKMVISLLIFSLCLSHN